MQFNPYLAATQAPPVMEARRWIAEASFPPERPLLNLSQAAPVAPPPAPLRAAMAEALEDPATHLYGPVLGLPELRAALAARMTRLYGGGVRADQIAITSGCNQAFCAAISALCAPGRCGDPANTVVFQPCDVAVDAGDRGSAPALR
jgi:aspartate/methionine/tyrosine aminotransferase